MKVPSKAGAVTLVGKVSDSADRDGIGGGCGPSGSSLIDELTLEGARRMLAEALQAEKCAIGTPLSPSDKANRRRVEDCRLPG